MSLCAYVSLIAAFLESSPSGEQYEEEGPGRRKHCLFVRRLQNDWREWLPYPSAESAAALAQQSLGLPGRVAGWCKTEHCAPMRMNRAVAGAGHREVAGGGEVGQGCSG